MSWETRMYLNSRQMSRLSDLLKTFFSLPYSTDLDGKDAETLIRIAKEVEGPRSKRKELFDIVDGDVGYSVKTLFKNPTAARVDLQEQRFCDVEEIRKMMISGTSDNETQGKIILNYMRSRIIEHMNARNIKTARSIILLKFWDESKTNFKFRYWEEDFLSYIDDLWNRNENGEIEWVNLSAGIHARDRKRQDKNEKNIRLLRMHHKHNQIFTDHDIPKDSINISFKSNRLSWGELSRMINNTSTI